MTATTEERPNLSALPPAFWAHVSPAVRDFPDPQAWVWRWKDGQKPHGDCYQLETLRGQIRTVPRYGAVWVPLSAPTVREIAVWVRREVQLAQEWRTLHLFGFLEEDETSRRVTEFILHKLELDPEATALLWWCFWRDRDLQQRPADLEWHRRKHRLYLEALEAIGRTL